MNGLTKEEFMKKVLEKFEIVREGESRPRCAKEFGLYMDKKWITIKAKDGTFPADDPIESLDVAILQNNLLAPILGIGDPRSDITDTADTGDNGDTEVISPAPEDDTADSTDAEEVDAANTDAGDTANTEAPKEDASDGNKKEESKSDGCSMLFV